MWCFWEFLFLLNHYVTLASWFLTLAFLLGLVFVFFNDWFFPIDSKTMFLFCANLLNIVSCVGLFCCFFLCIFASFSPPFKYCYLSIKMDFYSAAFLAWF